MKAGEESKLIACVLGSYLIPVFVATTTRSRPTAWIALPSSDSLYSVLPVAGLCRASACRGKGGGALRRGSECRGACPTQRVPPAASRGRCGGRRCEAGGSQI